VVNTYPNEWPFDQSHARPFGHVCPICSAYHTRPFTPINPPVYSYQPARLLLSTRPFTPI